MSARTAVKTDKKRLPDLLAALDAASDGVALASPDLRLEYANRALCDMAECERPEEMIGREVADFVTAETFAAIRAQAMAGELVGRDRFVEGVHRGVRGRLVPVEFGASVLRDEEGKPYGFVAIIRDITERQQAEEALAGERNVLRAVIDNLPDYIYVKDAEGRFLLNNAAHLEELGARTQEEVAGKTDFDLFPREVAARAHADEQAILQSGQPIINRERARTGRQGDVEWVSTTKAPWRDSSGKIVGIVGLSRDITERKQAEEALRESREKLQAIFDNVGVGVALIGPQMEVLEFNRTMRQWFPRVEPAKKPICHQMFNDPPRSEPCNCCPVVQTLGDGQEHEGVTEIRVGDAVRRFRIVSTALRDAAGRVVAAVETVDDVTEQEKAEAELQAKNRELESFVYTVSHDLRAPLVSLEGFARLLAEGYEERLDGEGQDYLRRLRANVGVMNSLLTDLLELSRVGRRQEPAQAVAVSEVVAAARESLAELVGRSGAKVEVAADLPPVWYSRLALSQVFVNLISNAIKFSRDGEPPRVEIGGERARGGYRFFVRDNGIGIAPEHRQRVFEIFSRLKQKNVEGVGIGLAIVKRIVESNGGEVGADSRPGEGSTFWFTVPDRAEQS